MSDQKDNKNQCPVCGAFKNSYLQYCDGCEEHRRIAEKLRQQRIRDRVFGPIRKLP